LGFKQVTQELSMSRSALLQDIEARFDDLRYEQNFLDAIHGIFVVMAVGALTIIAVLLAESLFHFSASVRTILFFFILFALLAASFVYPILPVLRMMGVVQSASNLELAAQVGKRFPTIRDRLLNLLQLQHEMQENKSLYSPELVDASFSDLADHLERVNFLEVIDPARYRSIRKTSLLIGASCVGIGLLLHPLLLDAAVRLIHFRQEYTPPAQYSFEILPGNKEIVKGETITITVRVASAFISPRQLRQMPLAFHWRHEGQTRVEEAVVYSDTNGVFHKTLPSIRTTTYYYVRFEGVESDHYTLTVLDRPVVRSFQVRLDYPAYTRIQARVQDEFVGDITAVAGTRATVTVLASKVLNRARLVFDDGTAIPMNIKGERAGASFTLLRDAQYHLDVMDREGLTNTDPVEYQIKILPDDPPTVAILFPGRNLDLTGDKSLPLVIHLKDDFGFSQLRLGYRLAQSRYEQITPHHVFLPIALPSEIETGGEVRFTWDLKKLNLVPEDVVEYFAEVFDNDMVGGPKSGRSQFYLLRLPSLEEVFTDLNKGHEQSVDDLKKTLEEAKELKEKIESINQDLKKNKDFDWQQQKKVEEMAKQYRDLQKRLENVQAKLDDIVQQMQQHKVLSDETLQKYFELQQLMQQLNSAELEQLLKQMQQAMQNINRDQLQQALQQLTFSEERFRQGIERTINLLKRIQIEQKLDELKKRAEQVEQGQKELEQQTAQQESGREADLARRQEDLVRQEQELERQARELEERMEEFFAEMPVDTLRRMNEALRQQQIGEQLQKAAGLLRQSQWKAAQQVQRQIGEQMQQYADQLEALQQEMLQQQAQHVLNELRKAQNNLLELSKNEEQLKQQAHSAPPNSPQLRRNAQEQMRVMQDLQNVITDLSELSRRSFAVTPAMGRAIGEALSRMQNAMRALDIRNGPMAAQEQQAAMAALNRAAMQVQQAMQAMMQAQGAGGLLQQLQMMAGQQMGINMQTQQLGEQMSQARAAEAARLALEQEALRKSVEQLNREAQASAEREKILGDLERITQEMKEVVTNLEQNQVNPETIQKQERILSRLLDASRSLRERDFEKRRRAQTGNQIVRRGPAELDPSVLDTQTKLREDLLKAIEQGYVKDYQELIRKYFEELQKSHPRR
jgi:hypothetical protein